MILSNHSNYTSAAMFESVRDKSEVLSSYPKREVEIKMVEDIRVRPEGGISEQSSGIFQTGRICEVSSDIQY